MSSEGSPHEASQSGSSGGYDNNTGTSHRDHCGGVGTGLRVRSAVRDGSSIEAPIADRGTSSPLKTELIPRSHRLFNS